MKSDADGVGGDAGGARGAHRALEKTTTEKTTTEQTSTEQTTTQQTSTPRLVAEIAEQSKVLAQKHWELARAELKADLAGDLAALRGVGLGALAALLAVNVLVTAGVLALATVMRGWLAALAVAAPLLVLAGVAAYLGYHRILTPLVRIRRALQKDVVLAREHLG